MKNLLFIFLTICSLRAFAQKGGTQIYVGGSGTKVLMTGFQQDSYTFPSGKGLSYLKVAYTSNKATAAVADAKFWTLSPTGERFVFSIDTIVNGFWKIQLPGEQKTKKEVRQLAELLDFSPVILDGQNVNYCLGRVMRRPPKELRRRMSGIFVCPIFTPD